MTSNYCINQECDREQDYMQILNDTENSHEKVLNFPVHTLNTMLQMHLQNIQDHQRCQYQIQQQDYVYMPLLALFEGLIFEIPKDVAAKSLTLQQLNVLGTIYNKEIIYIITFLEAIFSLFLKALIRKQLMKTLG